MRAEFLRCRAGSVILAGLGCALWVATFYAPPNWTKLLITQIMYNRPPAGEVPGDEFEFLESENALARPCRIEYGPDSL